MIHAGYADDPRTLPEWNKFIKPLLPIPEGCSPLRAILVFALCSLETTGAGHPQRQSSWL
jgi:hypothetical protein